MLGTRLTAAAAGVTQCAVGVLYIPVMPEFLVRRPMLPNQVNAVVYIEGVTPLWTVLFVVTAAALLAAALRGQGFIWSHIASGGVWALYGSSILYSALLTEPPVPVVAGTISSGVALLHIAIAIGCRDRGHR